MREKAHKNYMDGLSYDLSPFARLYVMAASSFFGEEGYYATVSRNMEAKDDEDIVKYVGAAHVESMFGSFGVAMDELMWAPSRAEAMRKAIEDSLAYDAELTLRFLVWLRTKAFMRATPAVGLAVAAHSEVVRGTGLLWSVSDSIMSRLDDVTNCLAYYLSVYGKPVPNSLKKVLAKRIGNATEYELAKYAGKNKSVSLRDAIRITHAHSDAVDKFYRGELSQVDKGKETWEAIISQEGSTKEAWTKAVGVMGHMALLRNLRNLEKAGVDEGLYLDKLVAGVKNGKQLPFRYYSACQHVSSMAVKEALEKCLDLSIENLPVLGGNSLVLVDNSGSAVHARVSKLSNVNVATCGNLMGVLTGLISNKGKIGVFGDKIKYMPINKGFTGTALGLLSTVNDIGRTVGAATENGIWLALDDAIKSKEWFDRIFIYSDMQAGHGGLYGNNTGYPVYDKGLDGGTRFIDVPCLVAKYRKEVNPDCKLYSVQIGGYCDAILPEFYPNTCILAGWSPELLRFVEMFEKNPVSIESMFRKEFGLEKK